MEALNLPEKFLERLKTIVPSKQYEEVLETFYSKHPTSVRLNTLKGNKEELYDKLSKEFALTSVSWSEVAFLVSPEDRERLTHHQLFMDGFVYIQNLSSMLPVIILDPHENERILDLAAAPGSKTSFISQLMNNQGEISAVEISKDRFFKMKKNLENLGVKNVRTFNKDGEFVWKACPEMFDKILIDAPCSTESRFHISDPETFQYWSLKKIKEMVKKQSRLLFSAINSLKVGGTLIYSTCSFSPEENEEVVDRLLKKFEGKIILENFDLPLDNVQQGLVQFEDKSFSLELSKSKRILPNYAMEGFFLTKIKKVASTLDEMPNRRSKF